MFEFQKLCADVESLDKIQRAALIAEKSVSVVKGMKELNIEGVHPVEALAAFIIGSAVSDGAINEKDYLYIYPSLEDAFGGVCDVAEIKHKYKVSKDVVKEVTAATKQLMSVVSAASEDLYADIIILCLLITSVDGKISLKEKRYIKQLIRA